MRWKNGAQCQKDTELGQNDLCRGVAAASGLVSSQWQGWAGWPLKGTQHESPSISPFGVLTTLSSENSALGPSDTGVGERMGCTDAPPGKAGLLELPRLLVQATIPLGTPFSYLHLMLSETLHYCTTVPPLPILLRSSRTARNHVVQPALLQI